MALSTSMPLALSASLFAASSVKPLELSSFRARFKGPETGTWVASDVSSAERSGMLPETMYSIDSWTLPPDAASALLFVSRSVKPMPWRNLSWPEKDSLGSMPVPSKSRGSMAAVVRLGGWVRRDYRVGLIFSQGRRGGRREEGGDREERECSARLGTECGEMGR
ncbi:hypothetical protein DFJ73DRAFT_852400 [Zopfochytrium polystomum]|nr:hypothetical protein DFJ73DRAFT_852400 [Zopfochytrium polystomum]